MLDEMIQKQRQRPLVSSQSVTVMEASGTVLSGCGGVRGSGVVGALNKTLDEDDEDEYLLHLI